MYTSVDNEHFQRNKRMGTANLPTETTADTGTLEAELADVEELGEIPYTGCAVMDGRTTVYLVQSLVRIMINSSRELNPGGLISSRELM